MMRAGLVLLSLCVSAPHAASEQQRPWPLDPPDPSLTQELRRLTIEELAELDVTSVSRRVERLSHTAGAVSVIRQDDFRRVGVNTLAEAGWELSVGGQNLLDPRHSEFGAPSPRRSEFERGFHIRSLWHF